ncbi:heavy metal translocating P-type ATPase [Rubrivirga marina]|uniref:P-type Cu(+) transporter n=1 Tax=Rubrivirga marina TaxID=1196024 RepID=A0A271J3V8_9BACT|nr:heavy metal translocating P-type ATPase [Rubrivirga marina]PAP78221.1 copper-translocating P-type ATPase [Rubrivirga marina]
MPATAPPPDDRTVTLRVEGMECASCSARVERVLSRLDGVAEVGVNLATERATVRARPGLSDDVIAEAIRKAGFGAETEAAARNEAERAATKDAERDRQRTRLWWAVGLTIPIWLLEMVPMLVPGGHAWVDATLGTQPVRLMLLALGTAVQFGPGLHFFRAGWAALRSGAPSMDTLVMIGTSAAYGYSVVATLAPGVLPAGADHVYFEAAATIITLILAGRYLEAVAKGRAGEAIRALLDLQPPTALALRNGEPVEVPLAEVAVGDRVLVKPGARVPVDGTVVEGRSFVDESAMTGEPVPVEKEPEATVAAGTVNGTGALTVEAMAVGGATALARIVRMVEDAQGSKPPIQALADRVVRVFVPFVLATAAVTFAAWMLVGPDPRLTYALVASVSVLIIACPCAMGIATPISVLVGTGRAAEKGAFVREGAGLQALAEADLIVFDKTGTLTVGRPAVTDVVALGDFDAEEAVRLAAAVERQSEHPIARALVEYAPGAPEAADVEAVPGYGVAGTVGGRRVAVGAERYLDRLGVALDPTDRERAEALAADGKTPVWVVVDDAPAALLAVSDPIKPGARAALDALRQRGLDLALITGDAETTARAVAKQLGIETVRAEVLPDEKADAVAALQAEGRVVAFVGDGINDAPALARADAGLAMGTGTDVAIEAGDVVLAGGDIEAVGRAVGVARATLRNIRQNLFWAFAYNVVLIPVAAGVLYPALGVLLSPMLAALAMVFSDLFVIGNALRLRSA